MKNKDGGGGGREGAYKLSSSEKGGLIENLRYFESMAIRAIRYNGQQETVSMSK